MRVILVKKNSDLIKDKYKNNLKIKGKYQNKLNLLILLWEKLLKNKKKKTIEAQG